MALDNFLIFQILTADSARCELFLPSLLHHAHPPLHLLPQHPLAPFHVHHPQLKLPQTLMVLSAPKRPPISFLLFAGLERLRVLAGLGNLQYLQLAAFVKRAVIKGSIVRGLVNYLVRTENIYERCTVVISFAFKFENKCINCTTEQFQQSIIE